MNKRRQPNPHQRQIIIDLEATCWEQGTTPPRQEIIEIGAIELTRGKTGKGPFRPSREFDRFVRPTREPQLSDFCRQLTSIEQADVDSAETFPAALGELLAWLDEPGDASRSASRPPTPFTWWSWGAYDRWQIDLACKEAEVPFPTQLQNHVNLKTTFALKRRTRPCGMARALKALGLPLEGQHHRAIDDVRNLARIFAALGLP